MSNWPALIKQARNNLQAQVPQVLNDSHSSHSASFHVLSEYTKSLNTTPILHNFAAVVFHLSLLLKVCLHLRSMLASQALCHMNRETWELPKSYWTNIMSEFTDAIPQRSTWPRHSLVVRETHCNCIFTAPFLQRIKMQSKGRLQSPWNFLWSSPLGCLPFVCSFLLPLPRRVWQRKVYIG